MPIPTPEQLLDNEDSLLLKEVRRLIKRVEQLEGRANAKTNFTNAAGAHVVIGTGDLFNAANPFTGTAILFPPYVHTSGNYHIFGMNAGVLQWGASADDGQLYAGGGDVIINQYGILFKNQQGELIFQDTTGGSTITLSSDAANWLVLANQFGGAGITFLLDDASHVVKQIDFDADGSIVLFDGNIDLLAGQYLINGVAHTHTTPLIIYMHGNDGTVGASPAVAYATPGLSGIQAVTEFTMVVPLAGTMKNLSIRTSGTQPASGSLVATLRKGGANTALTVTIPLSSPPGTYSDTTNTVALVAGDLIDIRFVNNASAASCLLRSITMQFEVSSV